MRRKRVRWISLFTIIFFGLRAIKVYSQDCSQRIVLETDTVSQDTIYRFQKNFILSDDQGKTGFAILGILVNKTIIINITTKGGGACVNEGDKIIVIFSDSRGFEFKNSSTYNCQSKSTIYLPTADYDRPELSSLLKMDLASLTVWTRTKFVTKNFSPEQALDFQQNMRCLRHADMDPMEGSIYTEVEEMPQFVGGYEKMMVFLERHLHPDWRNYKEVGTVYIQFIVEKDGSIGDFKVIRSVDPMLDQEVLRVVQKMPPWKPGKHNGQPVRVRFILPIRFKDNTR